MGKLMVGEMESVFPNARPTDFEFLLGDVDGEPLVELYYKPDPTFEQHFGRLSFLPPYFGEEDAEGFWMLEGVSADQVRADLTALGMTELED